METFLLRSHVFLQCVKVSQCQSCRSLCSVCMSGERTHFALCSSRASESFKNTFYSQHLMRPYQKSVRNCFFFSAWQTRRREKLIKHSPASRLSSFMGRQVFVAAYFPLCKHCYPSGTLKLLLKTFDKSFSPSDMVVKWLCAQAFISL